MTGTELIKITGDLHNEEKRSRWNSHAAFKA